MCSIWSRRKGQGLEPDRARARSSMSAATAARWSPTSRRAGAIYRERTGAARMRPALDRRTARHVWAEEPLRARCLGGRVAAFAAAPCACLSMASMICGHIGIGSAWPMPSIIRSLAPGIEAAVSLPPSGRTSGSTVPWITSVGAFTARSRSLRLPEARIARSCRPTPAGIEPALEGAFGARAVERLVLGKLPTRRIFQVWREALEIFLLGGRRRRHQHRGGLAGRRRHFRIAGGRHDRGQRAHPLRETRSRLSWAIMPPIDAPTRCADLMPSASISPTVSLAMSISL
jgi:hypothetical protein